MALRQELREGRFVVNEKCNEFSQGECDWAVHGQVIGTNNSIFWAMYMENLFELRCECIVI